MIGEANEVNRVNKDLNQLEFSRQTNETVDTSHLDDARSLDAEILI